MKEFSLFLRRWLPVVIWAGAVVYASTNVGSGNHTAGLLRSILAWFNADLALTSLTDVNFAIRKTAHVLQFVVYALLVWRAMVLPPALEESPWRMVAWTLASALALALTSEAIQLFSPLRTALLTDVALDFSGAVLGIVIILAYRSFSGRRPGKILVIAGWGGDAGSDERRAHLKTIRDALSASDAETLLVIGGCGPADHASEAMRDLREAAGPRRRILVCLGSADTLAQATMPENVSQQEILERFWRPACLPHGISCLDLDNARVGTLFICGGCMPTPGTKPAAVARPEETGAEDPLAALARRLDQALPGPVLFVSPVAPFEELKPSGSARRSEARTPTPCDPRVGRLLVTHAPSILLSLSASDATASLTKPVFGIPCLVVGSRSPSRGAVVFCPNTRTVRFL